MNRVAVFPFVFITLFLSGLMLPSWGGLTSVAHASSVETDDQFIKAEFVAYYTNLQRRAHGLAPLKMSKELTEAALLFAEDAIVNLGGTYCGHIDSLNRTIGDRLSYVGMNGAEAWAENVACGNVTAPVAVELWMDSDGHRANILTDTYTEIGVGSYTTENSGYIVQDFAFDPNISPLIINDEAPSTINATVALYLYDHFVRTGLTGIGPAVEMMISNSPDFAGAAWEPFTTEKSWQLAEGTGWRTVYVLTQDADGRRLFRSDRIYLGDAPVADQMLESYPSVRTNLTRAMITSQRPETESAEAVQISLDWEICESDESVQVAFGTVDTVSDATARGGQAQQMMASTQNAYTILWTQEYIPGEDMIGYVRLKVDNNQLNSEVVNVDVRGDGVVYGQLSIKGTDFTTANSYQEFPVRFSVPTGYKPAMVEFHIRQSTQQVIYFDGIEFYTDSLPFTEDFNWSTARPAHRSRGLTLRTVGSDGTVSAPTQLAPVSALSSDTDGLVTTPPVDTPADDPTTTPEVPATDPQLALDQSELQLQTTQNGQIVVGHTVQVTCSNCVQQQWMVSSDAGWLDAIPNGDQLEIQVDAAGLTVGEHRANLTVTPANATSTEASAQLTVVLTVNQIFMPIGTGIIGNTTTVFIPVSMN